jgi:urea transport system ATP-binding protein
VEPNKDAGTSRDSIGLGQRAGPGLDTRHGTILTRKTSASASTASAR